MPSIGVDVTIVCHLPGSDQCIVSTHAVSRRRVAFTLGPVQARRRSICEIGQVYVPSPAHMPLWRSCEIDEKNLIPVTKGSLDQFTWHGTNLSCAYGWYR